jgi:hypothetical protein
MAMPWTHRLPPKTRLSSVCVRVKTTRRHFRAVRTVATRTRNTHAPSPLVSHRWGGAAVRDAWVTRLNAVDSPLLGTHERARLRLPHQAHVEVCVFVCMCVWWFLTRRSPPSTAPQ